jgi:GntR family transcriptional regulator
MDTLALQLSEASGVPFYRQIEDQLAEMIRAGQLPEGARLPSVRELAGSTLVSLITVRRAYEDLAREGLIVRRQGQGTFVARGVAEASRSRAEAEAREGLEDAVGRARRLGLSDAQITETVDAALSADREAANGE